MDFQNVWCIKSDNKRVLTNDEGVKNLIERVF